MANTLTNYQCPACTGPLRFDGKAGKLVCDYCGSQYEVADMEARYAEKQAQADRSAAAQAEAPLWGQEETSGLRSYSCPSCGAELVCADTTAASSCPYCGNPTVMGGQFTGQQKPEFILPFRMGRAEALAALKKHYKGKPLLPKAFREENHLEELQGVYVPFWVFDASATAQGSYEGHRAETHREGDYQVTTVQHFRVEREGEARFCSIPADGSSRMPDAHMDAIEPFALEEMKPFSTAYLPGFMADRYDVEAQTAFERAKTRIENTTASALHSTICGYTDYHTLQEEIRVAPPQTHYALLPVWMLHTKWKGRDFLFAMNGQTGKLIGDLPIDKGRLAALFAGISLPLMLVLALLLL